MRYEVNDDMFFLNALKEKTNEAFDRLYAEYYRPLCYFAEGLVQNTDVAEDIVTESFIKLLVDFPTMQSVGQLKSYLYTITRNASFDHLRAQDRHQHSHEELRYLTGVFNDNAEHQLIRAEVLQAIYTAITSLPEKYREIVRLALLEGKKNEEIAAELNIAHQTVRNRKSEGLGLLRLSLRDEYRFSPLLVAYVLSHMV